jgi:RNA-directed DNA polymerase
MPIARLNILDLNEISKLIDRPVEELIALSKLMVENVKVEMRPKKSGEGFREICKPSWKLKRIQQLINKKILQTIPLDVNLQGGVPGRSTKANALMHIAKPVLLELDIKDFYPSIKYTYIYDLFIAMGCSADVSHLLTKLTTYNFHLAQGFPTSSTIANLILAKIIPRISNLCSEYDITFSTFQDNLYFSGNATVPDFVNLLYRIFRQEGFTLHKKTIMTFSHRQKVSGWVVNKKLNVSKNEYRNLRTTLFKCKNFGIGNIADRPLEAYRLHLIGRINRICEVNPVRGQRLLNLYNSIQ